MSSDCEDHFTEISSEISSSGYRKDPTKGEGHVSTEAVEKFNTFGILIWNPVPIMRRVPLTSGPVDYAMLYCVGKELGSNLCPMQRM